ncbi:MAG: group III truncated hemoglobin [Helicobacteraceae bacterium]|nr:group III truncated hemoglobin [Helicobacteraceae bacterium]
MKYDEINSQSIDKLMDIFYNKIRADKSELGEIFNNKVGRSDDAWVVHKAKIARFWRSMLLGEPCYDGQPMKAHIDLPPFPKELFNTWLEIFYESLDLVFNEKPRNFIFQRAEGIAKRFKYMIYEVKH